MTETTLIWVVILPVAVWLSSVRDVGRSSFVALLGDVSVLLGMAVVVVAGYIQNQPPQQQPQQNQHQRHSDDDDDGGGMVPFGPPRNIAIAFGSMGYLFLVHFLVLPLRSVSAMVDPHVFADRVVPITFVTCGILCGMFGLTGYALFGPTTEPIVLLNVTGSRIATTTVKVLLCTDLLFTYPVVMRPSIAIVEASILHSRRRDGRRRPKTTMTTTMTMTTTNRNDDDDHDNSNEEVEEDRRLLHHPTVDDDDDRTTTTTTSTTTTGTGTGTGTVSMATHVGVCALLGVIAAMAGTVLPAFGLLSGLVGGVSQTFLAFVVPPIMSATLMEANNENDDDNDDDNEEQPQPPQPQVQRSWSSSRTVVRGLWSLFVRRLGWRERTIVTSGLVLIVWTLQSTWTEVTNNHNNNHNHNNIGD
jgi:hypothetical protein